MASYYMLRPVCTSSLHPSAQDGVCCRGLCRRRRRRRSSSIPVFALGWRRDLCGGADLLSSFPIQLHPVSRSNSVGVLVPRASSTKEANKTKTEKDVGSLASKFPFFKEETWADRNGGVFMDPYADPGPDFDYRVYAANTMEGFEPPPEPRIPFGGPFEDYYDKYVGVDYVPKQEKPTSSFLMFLDELNKKRAEEEAKLREKDPSRPPFDPKPNKHLFEGKKPLFTLSRPIEPAPPPCPYRPPVPGEELNRLPLAWPDDEPEFVPRKKVVKVTESLSEPLIPKSKDSDIPSLAPQCEPAIAVAEKVSQNGAVEEFSPLSGEEQDVGSLSSQNQVTSDLVTSTSTSSDKIRPPTRIYDSPASSNVSPSLQTTSSEEVKCSSAPSIPQTRATQDSAGVPSTELRTLPESAGGSPVSPPTGPIIATSGINGNLFPQTRPIDESQQVRTDEARDQPLIPQTRPLDATQPRSEPPSPATTMFVPQSLQSQPSGQIQGMMSPNSQTWGMEASMPAVPLTRPVENLSQAEPSFQNQQIEEASSVSQVRPVEQTFVSGTQPLSQLGPVVDGQPVVVQTRPIDGIGVPPSFEQAQSLELGQIEEASSVSQVRPVEQTFVSGTQPLSQLGPMVDGQPVLVQTRPIDGIGVPPSFEQAQSLKLGQIEEASLVSQVRPVEQTFVSGTQPLSQLGPMVDGQPVLVQTRPIDGIGVPPSFEQAGHGFGVDLQRSQYYQPKVGDLVLGAVIHADTFELTLEIGAEQPGLMNIRDFQPFDQMEDGMVFSLSQGDASMAGFVAPPIGKTLVVEDQAANDGIYRGQLVQVGTVVLAEVQTFFDGRAVLSCKRPARILGFHRIEQLTQTGEPLQIKIQSFNDGGLQGYIEGVRAFLPKSELLQRLESHAALQSYVGRTLKVSVVQLEDRVSNVIISEQKPWMSENLLLGSVHELTINRIYPYGLQVEIDNTRIRGFIHISSISRDYVPSLHSLFTEGERIRAMLIKGRRPDQPSFSMEAVEPPNAMGLVLRDRQQVFLEAEEVAKTTDEYQLPLQERQIFALRSAPPSNLGSPTIANLPWLQL